MWIDRGFSPTVEVMDTAQWPRLLHAQRLIVSWMLVPLAAWVEVRLEGGERGVQAVSMVRGNSGRRECHPMLGRGLPWSGEGPWSRVNGNPDAWHITMSRIVRRCNSV